MWPTVSDLCKKPPGMKRIGPTRPAFYRVGPAHAEQLLLPRNASQAAAGQCTPSRYVSSALSRVYIYVVSEFAPTWRASAPSTSPSLVGLSGAGGERETCASTAFICNGSYSYGGLLQVGWTCCCCRLLLDLKLLAMLSRSLSLSG